jgi:hypothetical protein
MGGGTTFHFVDASPTEALETAREAADGQDVRIGGGPTIIRDFLAAGLVEYMHAVSDLLGAWPHTDPILRKASPGVAMMGGMYTEVVQLRAGNRLVSDITQGILQFCRDPGDGLRHVFVPHATAGVALISGTKGALPR